MAEHFISSKTWLILLCISTTINIKLKYSNQWGPRSLSDIPGIWLSGLNICIVTGCHCYHLNVIVRLLSTGRSRKGHLLSASQPISQSGKPSQIPIILLSIKVCTWTKCTTHLMFNNNIITKENANRENINHLLAWLMNNRSWLPVISILLASKGLENWSKIHNGTLQFLSDRDLQGKIRFMSSFSN